MSSCLLVLFLLPLSACRSSLGDRPEGWTDETHGKTKTPHYEQVFPLGDPGRVDLIVGEGDWQRLLANVEARFGKRGEDGGPQSTSEEVHTWIPSTVRYRGVTWWKVGFRFKGKKKQRTTWQQGSFKLPFKLEFDHFEKENPKLENQRFYGFKELAFENHRGDPSYVREKVLSDLLRQRGIPAPQTSFVRVYVDHGDGPVYFGLYTMKESLSDASFLRSWGETGGDLFESLSGPACRWEKGAEPGPGSFEVKKGEGDFSWLEQTARSLHAEEVSASNFRGNLEKTFDVDGFLQWLAVTTVLGDERSFGNESDSYFLYGDPGRSGTLRWLVEDHDQSLSEKLSPPSSFIPADRESWPLVERILADETYSSRYEAYAREFFEEVLVEDSFSEAFSRAHDQIAPFVLGPEGETADHTALKTPGHFQKGLDDILAVIAARRASLAESQGSKP